MRELLLQRRIRVREREVPPPLVRPRPVVDHIAGEVIVPCAHHIEKKRLLHVDEHRKVIRRDRNAPLGVSVQFVGDAIDRELLLRPQVLRQRIVLVFRPKCSLVLEFEVHRVLNRRDLVVVVTRRPRHDRPLVHLLAVRGVERRRLLERATLSQFIGAEIGVLIPQLLILRELVEHLAPLTVPFGMLGLVEDLFGHVARTYHRAGHDARYLPSRSRKAEDIPRQHTHTLPRLLHRSGGFARLRIVDDDKLRADGATVRLLVLHAANASRDAGDAHKHPRRFRTRDGR